MSGNLTFYIKALTIKHFKQHINLLQVLSYKWQSVLLKSETCSPDILFKHILKHDSQWAKLIADSISIYIVDQNISLKLAMI